jgi:Fe-S cluster assembly scaffold protein SufB
MSSQGASIDTLYSNIETDANILSDPETAHLVIDQNRVLGMNAVQGLTVDVDELEDGISAMIDVSEGTIIRKTVHLCFGVIPESGVQRIIMRVHAHKKSKISVLAHCVFPNAVDVQHIMDAQIDIDDGAEYSYLEKHIHSPQGGVKVYPKAAVSLGEKAKFKTEFELIRGRVGLIDIDYETTGGSGSTLEMLARVNGIENDVIVIRETAHLVGDYARGVLTTKIAVRDTAKAEVYNKLTASAPYARGHVDCKEIVQDQGVATATPIVEVKHPKAHVTHEAAIGSVDSKQLETLMSRGLSEDEAVELIIQGLLS